MLPLVAGLLWGKGIGPTWMPWSIVGETRVTEGDGPLDPIIDEVRKH